MFETTPAIFWRTKTFWEPLAERHISNISQNMQFQRPGCTTYAKHVRIPTSNTAASLVSFVYQESFLSLPVVSSTIYCDTSGGRSRSGIGDSESIPQAFRIYEPFVLFASFGLKMVLKVLDTSICPGSRASQLRKQVSSDSRIRRNFLSKLGVIGGRDQHPIPREPSRGSLLGKVSRSVAPLKGDDDDDDDDDRSHHGSCSSTVSGTPSLLGHDEQLAAERTESSSLSSSDSLTDEDFFSNKTRKISFSGQVNVCPIPIHSEYSKRIRDCMWTPSREAAIETKRNVIEYIAEGWNVKGVLDEDEMFRDPNSGIMVHPIHVERWQEKTGLQPEELFLRTPDRECGKITAEAYDCSDGLHDT